MEGAHRVATAQDGQLLINVDGSRMSTPWAESHDHNERLVTAETVKSRHDFKRSAQVREQ